MSDSIAAAIAQAQQAASQMATSHQAVATSTPSNTAVGAPVAAGTPLGLDDMMGGGVNVDHWLKVTPYGLTVGNDTKPMDEIEVFLDMAEIAYSYQIKYQLNGSAVYHRTYDRTLDTQGQPWVQTMQKAQQIDPKAYEYRSAEIPVVAAAAVPSKEAGKTAAEVGSRLGLTLSTTGWKVFQGFVRELVRKGIDPKTATLKLTLGFETKKKAGVNDWGVPTFLNVEEIDSIPLFDTVH